MERGHMYEPVIDIIAFCNFVLFPVIVMQSEKNPLEGDSSPLMSGFPY